MQVIYLCLCIECMYVIHLRGIKLIIMPKDKNSLKGFVDFNNTSQHAADSVMNKYFVGFPYSLPSQNEEHVSGIEDITDWVRNGYSPLYSRDGVPGYSFFTDGSGKVYRVSDAENINTSGMSPLSYSDMRKMLPKREYIGGKDYRFRTAQRIPGFLDKIKKRAEAYGIDPNLVLNRILHEGWIDQQVINYNGLDASQQGGYWNGLWDAPVSGYGSFGLDYAGNNLMNGVYELKDPDASWRSAEFTDYEGGNSFRAGTSLEADNLSSAIEILAAELAYRQGEVAKRYGKKGSDLNVWTNAAFNMGLNNDDFKNEDWVRNQYTYPDYYGQIETQKKLGGIVERFGADRLQQYFASGGGIHIKPSHRGRLTELKARTGKSEAELYNDGNPAHKKMVVFARNSRKWKHADGGLLRRFDDGTPGQLYYIPDFAAVDNTTPVNYVTESGPFLQLDADSLYGGEIAPAVMVADDHSKKTVSRAQHNANRRRVEEMMQDDAPLLVSPRDVTAVKQQIVAQPQVAVDKSSVESNVMDAMVHQNYGRLKKLNKAENKESIKALQRELLAHGYDLGKSGENKDGVDGVIGPKTLRALRAYRNEKPKVEYGNVEDPLPIINAVYTVASNIPGLKYFVPNSFRGTEDEARNLGYKTYIDPVDGKRKSVNYPVTLDGNDAPTKRDIAAAQMRKYGITGDFTSDKSAYQRNNYAYLPAYGYNFLAPFYNKKENLPVADPFTGRAVRLGADRVETGAEKAKDWYNRVFADKMGKSVVYTYADASPAREDYRNLYFGYPQRNNTLMVNENVDRMNSGEFRTGYAFVPRDTKAILALANGIGNGDGVQYTSGHQLGNFGYGRNADNERWYYDDWDLIGDNAKIGFSLIGGKPFQVYDRDFKGGKKK